MSVNTSEGKLKHLKVGYSIEGQLMNLKVS